MRKNSLWKKYIILILIVIIIALLSSSIFLWFLTKFMIYKVELIPYSFTVKPGVVGLAADNESLTFGSVPPGGMSLKNILINTTKKSLIVIKIEGDHSNFISVDKNNFIVNKEERVNFYLEIPPDFLETGTYNGTIVIYFFAIP